MACLSPRVLKDITYASRSHKKQRHRTIDFGICMWSGLCWFICQYNELYETIHSNKYLATILSASFVRLLYYHVSMTHTDIYSIIILIQHGQIEDLSNSFEIFHGHEVHSNRETAAITNHSRNSNLSPYKNDTVKNASFASILNKWTAYFHSREYSLSRNTSVVYLFSTIYDDNMSIFIANLF